MKNFPVKLLVSVLCVIAGAVLLAVTAAPAKDPCEKIIGKYISAINSENSEKMHDLEFSAEDYLDGTGLGELLGGIEDAYESETGSGETTRMELLKSSAVSSRVPDDAGEVMFYLNSLRASLALKEGNLKRADSLLSLLYDYSSVRPAYLNLHNQRLMEYYSQKGDYSRAYAYRVKVDEYDDSMRSVRHMANLAEMDYRYSNDTTLLRRNADLAESRADIARQSNVIILISTALVILLLLVLVAYVYVKRKNDRRYNEQLRQLARLRMENVRNRISPHYMFNVINAVMPLMRQHTELSRIMQLFVHVLRGNLVVSDSISVSLDDEIRLVKDFVSLRGETSSSVPRVEWNVDALVSPSVQIPSMSIQIPVENALKYAFASGIDDSSLISVDVSDVDSKGVLIHIVDNGAGLSSTSRLSASKGTGNGLKTLYSTVDLLNMRNASKMKISVIDLSSAGPSSHGTDFQLFVPYNYKFEI